MRSIIILVIAYRYVDVLKDELAQTKIESTTKQGDRRPISVHGTSPSYHHDQTILALKRVIERLRVENKNLKDGINISSKTPPDADSSFHVSKVCGLYTSVIIISFIYVLFLGNV